MWTLRVDAIRSAGREMCRLNFMSLRAAWAFVQKFALPGDQFMIERRTFAESMDQMRRDSRDAGMLMSELAGRCAE